MAKQVTTAKAEKTTTIRASVNDTVESAPAAAQQPTATSVPVTGGQQQRRSVYMTVKSYDTDNKSIGFRVVDLNHFGTSRWLQKHTWWAIFNHVTVEMSEASPEEVGAYLFEQEKALQAKYSKEPVAV